MILASRITREAGVSPEKVMLLRHSSTNVAKLLARGSSVEEYTFTQPTGSKYDYLDPRKIPVEVVVVIVNDVVYGVFKVLGVDREGTTYSLTSEAHRRFDEERGKAERPAKRFRMAAIPSASINMPVLGWERRSRTTVQRSDGGYFWSVRVEAPVGSVNESSLREELDRAVQASLSGDAAQRRQRLSDAATVPRSIEVTSFAYSRNPDVIAEVLVRANEKCELCRSPAPFLRKSDRTPYLELHHRVRLADGGEDTVANAIALCPNCHRREHYA